MACLYNKNVKPKIQAQGLNVIKLVCVYKCPHSK